MQVLLIIGYQEFSLSKVFMLLFLKDLDITRRFNCRVIAMKYQKNIKENGLSKKNVTSLKIPPRADDVFTADSVMILIGKDSNIEQILRMR